MHAKLGVQSQKLGVQLHPLLQRRTATGYTVEMVVKIVGLSLTVAYIFSCLFLVVSTSASDCL